MLSRDCSGWSAGTWKKEHLVATLTHIMPKPCFKYSYPLVFRLGYFCETKAPNWGIYNYSHRPALLQCKTMKWKACFQTYPWELTAASYICSTRESWGRKKNQPSFLKKAVLLLERRKLCQEGANSTGCFPVAAVLQGELIAARTTLSCLGMWAGRKEQIKQFRWS